MTIKNIKTIAAYLSCFIIGFSIIYTVMQYADNQHDLTILVSENQKEIRTIIRQLAEQDAKINYIQKIIGDHHHVK